MDNIKISIVTICFNAQKDIDRTINSVLNQSYQNIEYIVIDGGSTDGSLDIIKKYSNQISYWVSEPDKGIYDAMNKGVAAANGLYVGFINAGDFYYSSSAIRDIFDAKYESLPDVIYGYQVHSYAYGDFVRKKMDISNLNKFMPFGHPASFVKTDLLKSKGFDTSFKIAADYNLFYNLYKEGHSFEHRNVIVSVFDSTGISNSNRLLAIKETASINGSANTYELYRLCIRIWMADFVKKVLRIMSPSIYMKLNQRRRNTNSEYVELKKFLCEFTNS